MTAPVLRLRSDEQLVTLFRAGHDEAFRVIHDRYRQRLSAYTRQMLPRRQDAEDVLQDVFVRVYMNLRASERKVDKLRPWLYRTAHNRCIDELRRPSPPRPEELADIRFPTQDPVAQVVERESIRRVLEHVGRLPPQQRSALLLRELGGAHYDEIAIALGTSVPAIKSLLVRARITLASSLEARDTPCSEIREELALAHDRRVRPNSTARAHLRDCCACRDVREQLRGTSRQLKVLVPALGPIGILAKALGFSGAGSGASAGGGAAAGGGSAIGGGAAIGGSAIGGSAIVSTGLLSGSHVATLIAAAVVTAGGAVGIQNAAGTPSQSSTGQAPAISSPPPRVQPSATIVAPRPGVPSAASPQPPTTTAPITAIVSAPTGAPTGSNTSSSTNPGPVRQPAITGIATVSKPGAASMLGHTSITGIDAISVRKPVTKTQTSTGTSSATSSSGGGTGPTDSSGSSSSAGAQSGTTASGQGDTSSSQDSPQVSASTSSTDSSSSTGSNSSTDSSSSTGASWGTTGTAAVAS
jgi:RNA polymerase sigma factor (sigma-70 family)